MESQSYSFVHQLHSPPRCLSTPAPKRTKSSCPVLVFTTSTSHNSWVTSPTVRLYVVEPGALFSWSSSILAQPTATMGNDRSVVFTQSEWMCPWMNARSLPLAPPPLPALKASNTCTISVPFRISSLQKCMEARSGTWEQTSTL